MEVMQDLFPPLVEAPGGRRPTPTKNSGAGPVAHLLIRARRPASWRGTAAFLAHRGGEEPDHLLHWLYDQRGAFACWVGPQPSRVASVGLTRRFRHRPPGSWLLVARWLLF